MKTAVLTDHSILTIQTQSYRFGCITHQRSCNEFYFLLNQDLIYSKAESTPGAQKNLSVLFPNLSLITIIVSITHLLGGKGSILKSINFLNR